MERVFQTPNGFIKVTNDTHNGNPLITIDNEEELGIYHEKADLLLDNYQTYQLAITLLQMLEVDDNRGSK